MTQIKTIIRWALIAVVVVLTSNIAGANSHWVSVRFWPFGEIMTMPLWVVLLGGVCLGLLLAAILFGWRLLVMEVRSVQMNRRVKQMEEQTQRLAENNREMNDKARQIALQQQEILARTSKKDKSGDSH